MNRRGKTIWEGSRATLLFRGGTWQPLRKSVKGNNVKRSQTKRARSFDGFTLSRLPGCTR
jgi:hypothetical protein